MGFLHRITLTIMGLCALLIVAFVLIAYTRPLPDKVAMYHLDICRPPCWIGITPGITTLKEAEQQLSIYYPESEYKVVQTQPFFIHTIQSLRHDQTITVRLATLDGEHVSMITLRSGIMTQDGESIYGIALTASDLILQWGNPRYIGFWSCDGHWRPYYNAMQDSYILIRPSKGKLSANSEIGWNNTVREIELFSGTQELAGNPEYHQWQGFQSYRHYGYDDPNFSECGEG
jgi:hypothetical protein